MYFNNVSYVRLHSWLRAIVELETKSPLCFFEVAEPSEKSPPETHCSRCPFKFQFCSRLSEHRDAKLQNAA
jgi:hypothetical protein